MDKNISNLMRYSPEHFLFDGNRVLAQHESNFCPTQTPLNPKLNLICLLK